jgi:hypothetical protein
MKTTQDQVGQLCNMAGEQARAVVVDAMPELVAALERQVAEDETADTITAWVTIKLTMPGDGRFNMSCCLKAKPTAKAITTNGFERLEFNQPELLPAQE